MVICYVDFAESYRNDQQNEIKTPTLEIKAFRSLHHVVILKVKQVKSWWPETQTIIE